MAEPEVRCPTCGTPLDFSSYKCPGCGRDVASLAPTQGYRPTGLSAETEEDRIGEFRILGTIGAGGMGTVYEAYQESMRRRVALKVLNGVQPLSSSAASRFEREGWIAGALNHPNIVRVYSQGVAGTTRYIAMELVEGESLAAAIRAAKSERTSQSSADLTVCGSDIRKMASMFVSVADALQHVHEHGVVHRDIKPSNLLLTKDKSRLLLTDFGLARDKDALQLTRRGDLMGTVRYMSPEQLLAQRVRVDHRTDIWSLGVSLYEAVTLDLPYSGESEEAYMAAVSMKDPTPPRMRNRAVPRDLETVLTKCLERDAARRYSTAAELRDDLSRFLEGRPLMARPPGALLKATRFTWRHRRAVGGAAIAAIVVLTLMEGLGSRARHQTEIERVRWTLQQVINNPNTDPRALQPDWPRLEEVLQQEIRKDLHRDLTLFAQRAACRVTVSAPSFGLLSELPDLSVTVSRGVDPGKPFVNLVYVEGALDEGPWEPVGSAEYQENSGDFTYGGRHLDEFFPAAELTPAPHKLRFRATFRLFDPNQLSAKTKAAFREHNFIFGPFDNAWPKVNNVVPLLTETRALDPISINLFTEYPKDFPRTVFASQATGPPQAWYHLDRVRIIRVKFPPDNAPGFVLEWPHDKGKRSYCAPLNPGKLTNPVVGLEFFGRLEPLIPLAADATVWSNRNSKPLLSFTIVWLGKQLRSLGNATTESAGFAAAQASESSESTGTIWSYHMANFASANNRSSLPSLPDGTDDGITSGRIDFMPSRSVALATRVLDRYFGESVSIPVPSLQVVTVPGQWVQKEGCR